MLISDIARSVVLTVAFPAFVAPSFRGPEARVGDVARRWNADGHLAIAAIAWNHMTPASRARSVQLLRGGPALALLTELEPANEAQAGKDRQLFMTAATWADRVRSNNVPSHVYHHATWHYTDYYWRDANGRPEPVAGLAPDPENALERLAVFERELGSSAGDTTKAVALAWIEHLTGDVHQPLHLSGRVTAEGPAGDKGGNDFKLGGQPNNLHAYWDGALDLVAPNDGASAIAYASHLADLVERAVPLSSIPAAQLSAAFDAWGRESLDLAQREVYAPSLHPGDVPNAAYAQNAATIAERRVALAGYRLATLLNRLLQ